MNPKGHVQSIITLGSRNQLDNQLTEAQRQEPRVDRVGPGDQENEHVETKRDESIAFIPKSSVLKAPFP